MKWTQELISNLLLIFFQSLVKQQESSENVQTKLPCVGYQGCLLLAKKIQQMEPRIGVCQGTEQKPQTPAYSCFIITSWLGSSTMQNSRQVSPRVSLIVLICPLSLVQATTVSHQLVKSLLAGQSHLQQPSSNPFLHSSRVIILQSKHGHVTPCLMKASGHTYFTWPKRPHHLCSLPRTTPAQKVSFLYLLKLDTTSPGFGSAHAISSCRNLSPPLLVPTQLPDLSLSTTSSQKDSMSSTTK